MTLRFYESADFRDNVRVVVGSFLFPFVSAFLACALPFEPEQRNPYQQKCQERKSF